MRLLLLLLLFIPLTSFSQDTIPVTPLEPLIKEVPVFSTEDIERYKVYETTNIYTSLLLDTATGLIWQLQIGIGKNSNRLKTVLNDYPYASTVEQITEYYNESYKYWEDTYKDNPDYTSEDIEYYKPSTLEERLSWSTIEKNGRFKLYPTGNMYNFIMVDVIDGRTWQVQWNIDDDKRLVLRIN